MIPRVAKGAKGGGRGRTRRAGRRWEGRTAEELAKRWRRPEVRLFAAVDSTNDLAKELAREGAEAGTLVLADEQTAGRGRGDRRWASPKGLGLYFSLILRPPDVAAPAVLPILAGLAVVRALARVAPDADPALKWPNDVLAADRKCGGVLAEAAWDGERLQHVVLGVGLNVHTKGSDLPKALRQGATSVDAAAGRRVSRLDLMDAVLKELEVLVGRPRESLEPELLRDLDAYDWLRDRRCALAEPGREVETVGVAVGIAPDGALLFRPDAGPLRRVTSGRVKVPELDLPDY